MKVRIFAVSLLLIVGCTSNPTVQYDSPPVRPTQPEVTEAIITIPESALVDPQELQAKRRELIISLIRNGVFRNVEYRANATPNTVHLWIGPPFMLMEFDAKSKMIEVVYAYYFDKSGRTLTEACTDTVYLVDSFTDKKTGSYNVCNLGNPLKLK